MTTARSNLPASLARLCLCGLFAAAGCMAGTTPPAAFAVASMPDQATAIPSPRPAGSETTPQFVIPAHGGPILAIPMGGGLYQPVPGGRPVPDTWVTP